MWAHVFNPNWTGQGQSWPRQLWPQIAGKLIIFFLWPIPAKTSSGSFGTSDMTSKIMFWHPCWRIFVRRLAAASSAAPPLPPGFTAYTDHPSKGEVPPGRGSQYGMAPVKNSNQFLVAGLVECGGGGFSVGPALSLFLSGQQAPNRSGEFSKTGGIYSAVTHHTRYSLPRPGYFNLDLIGLSLLVRKWGLLLPHPVYDAVRGSRSN